MSESKSDAPKAELIRMADVAVMLGVSVRHARTMNALGKLPAPIRLGRSLRWRVDELRAWIAADCPPRERWRPMWAAREKRGRRDFQA